MRNCYLDFSSTISLTDPGGRSHSKFNIILGNFLRIVGYEFFGSQSSVPWTPYKQDATYLYTVPINREATFFCKPIVLDSKSACRDGLHPGCGDAFKRGR